MSIVLGALSLPGVLEARFQPAKSALSHSPKETYPTFKAARASLDILKVNNKAAEEKKKIGLLDLPGGKL